MARPRPVAILGLGAVGRALARELARAGVPLRLWARRPALARRLARQLGVEWVSDAAAAARGARSVLLCVPEGVVPSLVRSLGPSAGPKGAVLLTVSGVLPLSRRSGLGRLHPLAPVLARAEEASFAGLPFGLEGPPRARREARRLVRRLGGTALELSGRDPRGYHAGAALLGGGSVALFHLAEQALARSVPSRAARRAALVAFARRNLEHVARHGPAGALTGPIARGARANVRHNLQALARLGPARAAYVDLGRVMLELASLPRATRAELARLLTR